MKKPQNSEQLKRAITVIKADRLGVSAGIERVISSEVKDVLSDFFSLIGEVKTTVEIEHKIIKISVNATADCIKAVKTIE